MPTEFAAHVHEALLQAGAPHGLRPAGMFALTACRLEKGFRHFGHDIGEEDTPYETGLGFAVKLDKGDFVGKAALAKQKAEQGAATRHRTVAVLVEGATAEAGPYLMHNEPIWRGGGIVGHVTSGGWGWRLSAMVGLASLHNDAGVSKAWLEEGGFTAQIAGQHYPIKVQLQPFHDPEGRIMRG
jgi:4-methylaminobutanoate oxidase (formaldehyde-forming)